MAILFYIYDVIIITCGPLATFDLLFLFSSSSRPSHSALSRPSLGPLSRPSLSALCAPLYLRPSLASMHSVAWGTRIRRSLGMSLPVVLQMP